MNNAFDFSRSTPAETVKIYFSDPPPRAFDRRVRDLLLQCMGRTGPSRKIAGCVGCFFVFFSLFWLILVFAFTPWSYFKEHSLIRNGKPATLLVTKVEKTGSSINDETVYRVFARHPGESGYLSEIINYYTGLSGIPGIEAFDRSGRADPPYEVTALVSPHDPYLALLPGGRLSAFGAFGFAPLIVFVLVTLTGAVLFFLYRRRRSGLGELLRKGVLTGATVLDWQETSVVVNGKLRQRVDMSYETEPGLPERIGVDTFGDESETYRNCLANGCLVPVIHIPGRAHSAVFLPALAAPRTAVQQPVAARD